METKSPLHPTSGDRVAAVVIGRNEGERLVACLASLAGAAPLTIYVDSGSTDDSIAAAERAGASVVKLDMTRPFTAARARNAGVARLRELAAAGASRPDFVQFVDGDCALQPTWIPAAMAHLDASPTAAVVCGRRRERFPEASVYNRLCDLEWDTPIGRARSCGGDALVRLDAFEAVGGFRDGMIAGEEPELCVRLRAAGWEVWRLDEEMTLHDAAISRFGQWWKRARRAGHAFAEGAALHGAPPERHNVSAVRRIVFWSAAPTLASLGLATTVGLSGLALLAVYPAQIARLALKGDGPRKDWAYAFFNTMGKFPEMIGVLDYHLGRLTGRRQSIIEYK